MKIAVVYDFLIDRGGAEREILILSKALNADLITTHYLPNGTYRDFSNINIISYPLKTYPIPLLTQSEAAKRFKKINLSIYDIVISMGDWSRYISLNKTLKGRHIHITISPPRMFSDLKSSIEAQLGFLNRLIFKTWVHFASKEDRNVISKTREIIVQSIGAKKRVESYYNRKVCSTILYPPTELSKFKCGKSYKYFLSVQRIMPAKNIETQITAFNDIPNKELIIAGSVLDNKIEYLNELKKMANKNIKFYININDKELVKLYSHCECVIQTSKREDFGLVPIEAMASCKPCIAVNEGGFKETIVNGKTGILINKPYVKNLINAVITFDGIQFNKKDLIKRASQFSDDAFIKKINYIIHNKAL